MRRLLRKLIVAEIVAAIWLGAVADYWAAASGRRLGKFSGKFSGNNSETKSQTSEGAK